MQVPAVPPDELPAELDHVLLAVKAHHTRDAMQTIAPRLAAERLRRLAPERDERARDRGGRGRGAGRRRVRQLRRRRGRPGADPARKPRHVQDRRARRQRVRPRTPAGDRHRRRRGHDQRLGLPVGEGGLRRDAVRDRRLGSLDRRCPGRPRLPAALSRAGPRGARPGDRHAGAVRRVRPERSRRLDRPARRVQPRLGQDPLRHLPRPRRPPPQDRGRRDARRPRGAAPAPHRGADPRDRGRPPGLRAGEPRPARRLRAARAAGPAAERGDRRRRRPRPGRRRARSTASRSRSRTTWTCAAW